MDELLSISVRQSVKKYFYLYDRLPFQLPDCRKIDKNLSMNENYKRGEKTSWSYAKL